MLSVLQHNVCFGIGAIKKIKPFVPTSNLINIYQSIVEPYLDYCSVIWDYIGDQGTDKLQILLNRAAARVITGADYRMPTSELLNKLGCSCLKGGETNKSPHDALNCEWYDPSVFSLRISRRNLALPAVTYKTDYHRNSFTSTGAKIWNALPDEMKCRKAMHESFFRTQFRIC